MWFESVRERLVTMSVVAVRPVKRDEVRVSPVRMVSSVE